MSGVNEDIRSEAESLDPDGLTPFRLDLEIVRHNAQLGIDAVTERERELKATFKHYEPAAQKLIAYVEALELATEEVELAKPVPTEAQKLAQPVYEDRNVLMAQLIAWQLTGMVPRIEVERIKAGSGLIDAARDVLAIVKLTEKYPVTKPKLMSTDKELKAMVKRANALLAVARRTGSRDRANDSLARAQALQSRIWKLVVRQHEVLWVHGALLFGRDVDTYVPPLGSRLTVTKKNDEVPSEPTPA